MPRLSLDSPVGRLTLFEEEGFITGVIWGGKHSESGEPTDLLNRARRELSGYFAGKRTEFDLPVKPDGSPSELAVWRAMAAIPYGRTRTYGEIAREVGINARAVGQACGRNPIPILLPCHRVVAANGLGGFSAPGGVDWKGKLLVLERALLL
ncbi:MAG TPA: methylated-DNA--[protein]-cysteine S-methyltransferase [Stellaceae bacterium]|nr:methylated-DNA--[protein]-cysteine S-methyltransferase [Stellaceae bacterium]